jgi:hypothetical protein
MSKEQAIEDALSRIDGVSRFLGRREVKELPNILWEDELPERIAQGLYKNGSGILVATNKRLIFVDKGLLWGLRVEDFPLDKISSIEYQTGIMFGRIIIYASGNKADIEQVDKKSVRDFAEYVRARITKATAHASLPASLTAQQSEPEDAIARLERLARLREVGTITPEEFEQMKRKLIDSM